MTELTPELQKKMERCSGCEDDFYNNNNPYNVKVCWGLEKARLIRRQKVGVWQNPPYKEPFELYFACYKQKGFSFRNKEEDEMEWDSALLIYYWPDGQQSTRYIKYDEQSLELIDSIKLIKEQHQEIPIKVLYYNENQLVKEE